MVESESSATHCQAFSRTHVHDQSDVLVWEVLHNHASLRLQRAVVVLDQGPYC